MYIPGWNVTNWGKTTFPTMYGKHQVSIEPVTSQMRVETHHHSAPNYMSPMAVRNFHRGIKGPVYYL